VKRILLGIGLLATVACSPTHLGDGVPAGSGPLIGVYKAAIDDGEHATRRARLSLWVERPDRLHAELIAPVGGVTFILDAGGGKACIIDVAEATAYVGADGPNVIEALVGVRLSVADAVNALLEGSAPSGLSVTRIGGIQGLLPDRFRIADGSRSLALERVRFERGTTDPRALGTGVPPGTLAVEPLEHLASQLPPNPEPVGGDR
jgi:hypothetical protein